MTPAAIIAARLRLALDRKLVRDRLALAIGRKEKP